MEWCKRGGLIAGLGLGMVMGGIPARAQNRERDVMVTGPRGKTVERRTRSGHAPGTLNREIQVQRPGGLYQREVHVARQPGFAGGPHSPPPPVLRPGGVFRREVIVERRPSLGTGGFVAAPFFSLFFGTPAPPPPVVYYPPPPVYIAPPPPAPVVVYNPPQPYVPPRQQPVVVDPVADAMARLRSDHDNSRRDGAYTLGRLGDPRAIPALTHQLKDDEDTDARVAAATALGRIGDPQSATALQLAATYDRKRDVREAAVRALAQLPREIVDRGAPVAQSAPPDLSSSERNHAPPSGPSPSLVPIPDQGEDVPPIPIPPNEPGFVETP